MIKIDVANGNYANSIELQNLYKERYAKNVKIFIYTGIGSAVLALTFCYLRFGTIEILFSVLLGVIPAFISVYMNKIRVICHQCGNVCLESYDKNTKNKAIMHCCTNCKIYAIANTSLE